MSKQKAYWLFDSLSYMCYNICVIVMLPTDSNINGYRAFNSSVIVHALAQLLCSCKSLFGPVLKNEETANILFVDGLMITPIFALFYSANCTSLAE